MLEDAPHVSTGWHGLCPTVSARKQILALLRNPKKMQTALETFRPVPADLYVVCGYLTHPFPSELALQIASHHSP